jgi:dipeptidyl-peptidase-4
LEKNRLKPLTDGDWEVTHLHGMDENSIIYFNATAVEPEQVHLFSYNYSNAQMKKLTSREGWHQITFSPNFRYFTDLYSDQTQPPQLSLSDVTQKKREIKILDVSNPEISEYELSRIEYLTVKSRDGFEIHCKMFKPIDFQDNKRYPLIAYVHGGGYAQSVRKQWRGIAHLFHHYLAQELKYIVVDVDYRGSSGYGRQWRTDVYLHLGGKDLEDVIDVVEQMKKLPYIDPENIGIWGWSYGGFLTNMALLKTPDIFQAGAAVAPVNDWKNYDTQYTEERLSTPQDAPEAYERSSPVSYAKNLRNHLLMIHGMKDDNVHFQDTVQLISQLIDHKIDFDLMIYPEGAHGIRKDSNRIHLFHKIAQHFERYLK